MSLIKEAREFAKRKFEENPKMPKEDLIEIIRPHYIANYQKLVNQDLGRLANYIASRVKDEKGLRQVFAIENEGKKVFVHIDKSNDLNDLKSVFNHLVKDRDGRDQSINKVRKRGQEVAGQQSLQFDVSI